MLFTYIAMRDEFEHYVSELWNFILHEKPNVQIHRIYPLQDVARAHEVSTITHPPPLADGVWQGRLTFSERIWKDAVRRANCCSSRNSPLNGEYLVW